MYKFSIIPWNVSIYIYTVYTAHRDRKDARSNPISDQQFSIYTGCESSDLSENRTGLKDWARTSKALERVLSLVLTIYKGYR